LDAGARHVLPRSAQIQGLLRKAGHVASTAMQIGLVLEKGAKVVIAGRDEERSAKAFEELKAVSPNVSFHRTDASDPKQAKDLIDFAVKTYDSIDIIYNNTGIDSVHPVDQMGDDDFNNVVKYAAQQMEQQDHGGAIVSTSSIEGSVGDPNLPSYNASKGGVNLLTQSVALTLAEYNIRVNAVNPGYVYSGAVNGKTKGKEGMERLAALHPLGRLGKPEEIAHGVMFLVENEFTTGTHLYIDGGYLAQ